MRRAWRAEAGLTEEVGGSGVVGSGRRGGIPMEGGFGGCGVGVVKKTRCGGGGGFGHRQYGSLLKGGSGNTVEGGRGSRATRGAEQGRERGARARRKMARAAGISPRPAGGGTRAAQT
jgi:hypothetical protein